MGRYKAEYASTTGFGWHAEEDNIKEFSSIIKECRNDYYAHLIIWDERKKDFVFWKRSLQYKPDIDKLRGMATL